MNTVREQFEPLAALLTYPRRDYAENAARAVACCGAVSALTEYGTQVSSLPLDELQELYTRTFDLRPICPLELGWHLFGEDYDRGLLLARMRGLLREHGITEQIELPDHLSHAMLLLARMEPTEAGDFASVVVVPALERMLSQMPDDNLFSSLLQAVRELMGIHFPAAFEPASPQAEGAIS